MMYKEYPTNEDLLNCEFFDFCGLTEYNDCAHRKICEILHLIKLSSGLEEIVKILYNKDEKGEN